MDESKWDSLLVKYTQGTISEPERKQLLEWVDQSQANRRRLDETQAIWQATAGSYNDADFSTNQELAKLLGQISSVESIPFEPAVDEKAKRRDFRLWQWVWQVAAAVVLLVGVYVAILKLSSADTNSLTIKQTTIKEKQKYLLPDGSVVWLNEQSQISYLGEFESQIREVFLSGEAFFEVVKDRQRPFVIHAGKTVTQVVGTSFNLRALPDEQSVKVSVVSGEVNFFLKDQPARSVGLTPGMTGYWIENSDSVYFERKVDPNILAWQNNRLIFQNATVEEVVRVIEKHFKVSVQVAVPGILACRFTSTFENAQLTEVLESLTMALDLRYTQTGNRYILTGQGCSESLYHE
jgi:transmembrane sensor